MKRESFDILAIDDEQVILDSISKIGFLEDLTVDTCDSGAAAIEKLGINSYRLIISDIMMPVMDGFALLDKLRAENHPTPVIMTTGFSTIDNAMKSLKKGAIEFIAKPFTVEEVAAVIGRGIKYSDIVNNTDDRADNPLYVPCPTRFYRIGYSCWVNISDSDGIHIGLTDLFNKTIDSISKIELLETGDQILQANYAIKIETENGLIHNVYSPLSGKITARNDKVLDDITLLEKDPYFEGWIYKIDPADINSEIINLIPCC